jgi:hypothetical protein
VPDTPWIRIHKPPRRIIHPPERADELLPENLVGSGKC